MGAVGPDRGYTAWHMVKFLPGSNRGRQADMCIYIYIYTYVHICIKGWVSPSRPGSSICMYVCMYIYIYIYIYISIFIHMCVCMYMYIYIYIYIHA